VKVGILGTGDVGRALGAGFVKYGHEALMGAREAGNEKAKAWAATAGPKARAGTFAEAARFGDLVVLATLWSGTENALKLAGGPKAFAGKIVVDVTNPLDFSHGMPPRLALGHSDSGGEQVQRWLPEAKVVKAFNIVGNAHMVNPDFPGGPPDMMICGNDEGAKRTVTNVCRQFGWPVIDIGNIEGARLLEPLCILWVIFGMQTKSWGHAFKLLRKQ
jgi:predicted dinucleotide-binding enzyme